MIDKKEWDEAEAEAQQGADVYTHKFAKPFSYEGKAYEELTFDFGKLTGNDYLAIEEECQALGRVVVTPTLSGNFLVRMAARACREKVSSDLLMATPIADFSRIRSKARSFLLKTEL